MAAAGSTAFALKGPLQRHQERVNPVKLMGHLESELIKHGGGHLIHDRSSSSTVSSSDDSGTTTPGCIFDDAHPKPVSVRAAAESAQQEQIPRRREQPSEPPVPVFLGRTEVAKGPGDPPVSQHDRSVDSDEGAIGRRSCKYDCGFVSDHRINVLEHEKSCLKAPHAGPADQLQGETALVHDGRQWKPWWPPPFVERDRAFDRADFDSGPLGADPTIVGVDSAYFLARFGESAEGTHPHPQPHPCASPHLPHDRKGSEAASPAGMTANGLQAGMRMQLCNMQHRPDLNGKVVQLVRMDHHEEHGDVSLTPAPAPPAPAPPLSPY